MHNYVTILSYLVNSGIPLAIDQHTVYQHVPPLGPPPLIEDHILLISLDSLLVHYSIG